MSTFTIPLVIAKRKQTALEKNHGKIVHPREYPSELGTIAIVPWFLQIEYISCFSCLLNKSAIFFKMRAIEAIQRKKTQILI